MLILLLFPVLLKEFLLVGMLVWLLLILRVLVLLLMLLVGSSWEEGTGSRRDFFVGCPGALVWLLLRLVLLLIGGSLLTFQFSLAFVLVLGCLSAHLACLLVRYS